MEERTTLSFTEPFSGKRHWRPHWQSTWVWPEGKQQSQVNVTFRFGLRNMHYPSLSISEADQFPRLSKLNMPSFIAPTLDFRQAVLALASNVTELDERHRPLPVNFAFDDDQEPVLSEIQTNTMFSAGEHLNWLCLDVGLVWLLDDEGLVSYQPRVIKVE